MFSFDNFSNATSGSTAFMQFENNVKPRNKSLLDETINPTPTLTTIVIKCHRSAALTTNTHPSTDIRKHLKVKNAHCR